MVEWHLQNSTKLGWKEYMWKLVDYVGCLYVLLGIV